MNTRIIVISLGLLALTCLQVFAKANVIYQATLLDGTNPASGTFDLKFTLYAKATGGEPLGVAYTNEALRVTNGRVQTMLVCKNDEIQLEQGWVEAAIRPAGSEAAFVPMRARVENCRTHRPPPGKPCDEQCEFVVLRLETKRLPFSFDPAKPHRGHGSLQLPQGFRRSTSP